MAYLAAVTAVTGVPLFIRTKGDLPALSFPVLGSLSTLHLFASQMKASLLNCTSGGAKVLWKCFHDSITLILVTSNDSTSEIHMNYLLELVFNSMVLLVGLQELETITNTERLKKDLKCCYALIDHLLEGGSLMTPLTRSVDVIAVEDTSILASTLEAFAEGAQSNYGCLTISGRLCVATKSWWELSTLEVGLLSLFLFSLPPASCRDIPIYLPKASNKVAHRLLVFTLLEGVELCVLCGAEPPLKAVQELLEGFWSGLVETLRACLRTFPRCVPLGLKFDPSVLAFCLVNVESCRCLTSLRPSTAPESLRTTLSAGFQGEMDVSKRQMYLTRFYKTVVDNLLPSARKDQEQDEPRTHCALYEVLPHKIVETYTCAKRYKAYAMRREHYNLFVLFTSATPTFALKKMTADVFQTLTQNKPVI